MHVQAEQLLVSLPRSLCLDGPAFSLFSPQRIFWEDQPSQRQIKPDSEVLQINEAFTRKMGSSPLSLKKLLEFINETNVCVFKTNYRREGRTALRELVMKGLH